MTLTGEIANYFYMENNLQYFIAKLLVFHFIQN